MKRLFALTLLALIWAAPSHAAWEQAITYYAGSCTALRHVETDRADLQSWLNNYGGGYPVSYRERIDGTDGTCRTVYDGITIHFDAKTCPSEATCPDVQGAIDRAKFVLERDKDCPGAVCKVRGEDWYKYQMHVVDIEACMYFQYMVTLKAQKQWLWADPRQPDYYSATGYLSGSAPIEEGWGCGGGPGGGNNW